MEKWRIFLVLPEQCCRLNVTKKKYVFLKLTIPSNKLTSTYLSIFSQKIKIYLCVFCVYNPQLVLWNNSIASAAWTASIERLINKLYVCKAMISVGHIVLAWFHYLCCWKFRPSATWRIALSTPPLRVTILINPIYQT